MLVCGEDLGMVLACVPHVMNDTGILSLFVERISKQNDLEFTHPKDCPYLSVCSTLSHDIPNSEKLMGKG